MGTGMTPTSEMVRAQKDTVLGALKRGEADCVYASWAAVAAPF
jgi:hypothetical protein